MPGFASIIDQDRPLGILTTLLRNGTIPHALLFTGIEGVGKRAAALALAMACNCEQTKLRYQAEGEKIGFSNYLRTPNHLAAIEPCGRCKSCRKIESGNHPDIIQINPSGPLIRIAQIRELCHTLAMKPYEARHRVVIIADAQTMNPAAGNALLKMLEEPPARTLLVLTTTRISDLLPTIVSRCQHLRFNPISSQNLEALLVAKHRLDPADAKAVAPMAHGSVSQALRLSRTNWINRRNWLIGEVETLSPRSAGRILALAERLSQDKESLPLALEMMKFWLRDLVIVRYDTAKIVNKDLTRQIQRRAQKNSVQSILSKIEAIEACQKAINANTNLRLTLETMLLELTKIQLN
ncbi:MAG: DNA polymerase III subunit delta' [Desulfobacterales bacterium]|nr:MAG: DNA polymerase III subunit delta' [Desulfobacterales bacterium]